MVSVCSLLRNIDLVVVLIGRFCYSEFCHQSSKKHILIKGLSFTKTTPIRD